MGRIPNQRTIIIQRDTDKSTKNYLKVSNNSLYEARGRLDDKGFMLWLYLCDNANRYSLDFYSVDFCKKMNQSDSTYRRAWKELVDQRYLVQSTKNKSLYIFKEMADPISDDKIKLLDYEEYNELMAAEFSELLSN